MSQHFSSALVLVVATAACLGGVVVAKEPRFKSAVIHVAIAVVATDHKSQFVDDLKVDDFEVFEDGALQNIADFKVVMVKALNSTRSRGGGTGDMIVAQAPLDTSVPIYVIILDDVHATTGQAMQIRRQCLELLGLLSQDNVLVSVLYASGGGQNLTHDLAKLTQTVDQFRGRFTSPETADERLIHARLVLQRIQDVAAALGAIPDQQKALLLFSPDLGCEAAVRGPYYCGEALRRATSEAQRGSVSIYGVTPYGLSNPGIGSLSDNRPPSRSSFPRIADGTFSGLRALATDTGGFLITEVNNTLKAFQQLVANNTNYYLIGYYSTNKDNRKRVHENRVVVKRKDVKLMYRRSYTLQELQRAP